MEYAPKRKYAPNWAARNAAQDAPSKQLGRANAMLAVKDTVSSLLTRMDVKSQLPLLRLWQNWDMVMGPDLAALALPLGTRGEVLLVGTVDTLAMQELSYAKSEILERVNIFLEAVPRAPILRRVELTLDFGRTALDDVRLPKAPPTPPLAPCPDDVGQAYAQMRPDSIVTTCYLAYLRMHKKEIL